MTEVLGLRLAYRGFVTGLAAAYVWLALAMIVASLVTGDALAPLRPLATAMVDGAGTIPELAFVIGFALVQLGGAMVGMCFAYFFGRFFTVRKTLAAAAPLFALLAWALLATGLAALTRTDAGLEPAPLVATLFYGLVLGIGLPLRGDVLRATNAHAGSPVT